MTELPYPHTRNDCEMCREHDADVHVLGAEFNRPGKRQLLLCAECLGKHIALRVIHESGEHLDQPVAVIVTVAPGRRP
jgi:hypothetical protein